MSQQGHSCQQTQMEIGNFVNALLIKKAIFTNPFTHPQAVMVQAVVFFKDTL